jgi:uncharacterized protein YraI
LNLRTGPGTSNSIRTVIPSGKQVVTVNQTSPSNGFYNVKYNGLTGWSSGNYLKLISQGGTGGGSQSGSGGGTNQSGGGMNQSGGGNGNGGGGSSTVGLQDATPDGAVLRAQSAVGGSYWWGAGKWYPFDVGGSNEASHCTGTCPNCSHSGSSGADCSGYVAKLWQVPSYNTDLTVNDHTYTTGDFDSDTSKWHTVSRSSLVKADALVYHSGGAGHVFLYESGDGWGSINAYEAKGCSYGILHDTRTASTAYHGIRHY